MRFTRWDQTLSTEETNEAISALSLWHTSNIICPTTRSYLQRCIVDGNYRALCDYVPDYSTSSVADIIEIRQVLAFYQKRDDLDLGVDKEAVAYEKYIDAELLCAQTNYIFKMWSRGRFQFRPRVEAVLHSAQRKIASILGDVPDLSQLEVHYGPGGTTQLKRKIASTRNKLSQVHCCSEDLQDMAGECLAEMPGLLSFDQQHQLRETGSVQVPITLSSGNLSFVPKNAKTYRSVVVEPALNLMFQLGIGTYMQRRLKRSGIDLTSQIANQQAARVGSITGDLATLDLSSASDTIARELVAHLLPLDWFCLLDQLKTSRVEYKGQSRVNQKFSSMGNGFTFPLESLIFYALAVSTVNAQDVSLVSVYGDDIIVPTYAYAALTEVLTAVGFLPNVEKSFSTGPFRESCGADYLSGIDVRPVYQKTVLSGFDAFRLHNYYVRGMRPDASNIALSLIAPDLRIWGPDGYGDGHLLGDGLRVSSKRLTHGYGGYTFDTYTFKPKKCFKAYPGDYVYPLYTIYRASLEDDLCRPKRVAPYQVYNLRDWTKWNGVGFNPAYASRGFTAYDKKGRMADIMPGVNGYKRISIYTLSD